jgi:hypothetical protein
MFRQELALSPKSVVKFGMCVNGDYWDETAITSLVVKKNKKDDFL